MENLTSLKNPKVVLWKSLKDRKARLETGLFLVEGRKMVREALDSAFEMDAVLADERFADEAAAYPCPAYIMPEHVLAAVCDTRTPQGIAAVLRLNSRPVTGSRLIALDGVQDPGNVGTIIRTADAAGLDGILLSRECADVFSPKVLRATMGSIYRMPIEITSDLPSRLTALREDGFSILSSQLDGDPFYSRPPVGEKFCLIVGNEGNGVSDAVQATATYRLKLPMRGGAESLNAAIAAGIMMYDLMRDAE